MKYSVTILSCALVSFSANLFASGTTAKVHDMPLFPERLEWVGESEPPDVESEALLATAAVFYTLGIDAGIEQLEQFLRSYPDSAWASSLHLNLGQYYNNLGRFTLAMSHWNTAWNNRERRDEKALRLAGRVAENLSCLLGSLGKKTELSAL